MTCIKQLYRGLGWPSSAQDGGCGVIAGHTPGPWLLKGANAIVSTSGTHVAYTSADPPTEQERANASLIAAAPSLRSEVDRLRSIVDAIKVHVIERDPNFPTPPKMRVEIYDRLVEILYPESYTDDSSSG